MVIESDSNSYVRDYDEMMLKWDYSTITSTASFFSTYKTNKLGAESRFHVFVSAKIDGEDRKDICLLINGETQSDKGILFTRDLTIDFVFNKLKEWAPDAPLEWKIEAEKGVGHLFREQLRTSDTTTEMEIKGGGGFAKGLPRGGVGGTFRKKKELKNK